MIVRTAHEFRCALRERERVTKKKEKKEEEKGRCPESLPRGIVSILTDSKKKYLGVLWAREDMCQSSVGYCYYYGFYSGGLHNLYLMDSLSIFQTFLADNKNDDILVVGRSLIS